MTRIRLLALILVLGLLTLLATPRIPVVEGETDPASASAMLLGQQTGLLSVYVCGALGDGSDQTAAMQTCADQLKTGGTLFVPKGSYTFSNAIVLTPGTRVLLDKAAVVTAAPAADWHAGPVRGSSTPWVAGQVQMAFLGNTAGDYEISGGKFIWPKGTANHGGGAAHILEFNNATRVRVHSVVTDGGGDFLTASGSVDIEISGNTATNLSNGGCDFFGGAINAKCNFNSFTTFQGAGSGVGLIQFTGINADGSAANTVDLVAVGNDLTINNGNAQCVIINGHPSAGSDNQFIVTNNKCHVAGGHSAWGYLVTGTTNYGVIADNECDGGTTNEGNYSCAAAFSPAAGVLIHDNVAHNWQAGIQGVFINMAAGGSLHDNQAFSSGQLLGTSAASIVEYGNDDGTGNWIALKGSGRVVVPTSMWLQPVTAPAPPASGWVLYTDSGDSNKLKAKAATGTVVVLGTP